jgi:hypothetical protein
VELSAQESPEDLGLEGDEAFGSDSEPAFETDPLAGIDDDADAAVAALAAAGDDDPFSDQLDATPVPTPARQAEPAAKGLVPRAAGAAKTAALPPPGSSSDDELSISEEADGSLDDRLDDGLDGEELVNLPADASGPDAFDGPGDGEGGLNAGEPLATLSAAKLPDGDDLLSGIGSEPVAGREPEDAPAVQNRSEDPPTDLAAARERADEGLDNDALSPDAAIQIAAETAELFGDDPLADLPDFLADDGDLDLGADIAGLTEAAASGEREAPDDSFEESLSEDLANPLLKEALAGAASAEMPVMARASGEGVSPQPQRGSPNRPTPSPVRSVSVPLGDGGVESAPSDTVVANLNRTLLSLSLAVDFPSAARRAAPVLATSGLSHALLLAQDGKQATPLLVWETPPGATAPEIAAQNLYSFAPQALVAGLPRYGEVWQPAHDAARAADFKPLSAWAAEGRVLMALAVPAANGKRLIAIAAWNPAPPGVMDAAAGILQRLARLL